MQYKCRGSRVLSWFANWKSRRILPIKARGGCSLGRRGIHALEQIADRAANAAAIFAARIVTGIGWRLHHWWHKLPVPEVRPFHCNAHRYSDGQWCGNWFKARSFSALSTRMLFQITSNPYIPMVFGFLCAAGLTHFCNWFWHWRRGLKMPYDAFDNWW
jgi:hypothetical protein